MNDLGRVRTAENYLSALNSFKKYRNGKDIVMRLITSDVMEGYQSWLKKSGMVPNTVSFYMRALRAVYNRAVDDSLVEDRRPFRRVFTGVDKTVKRALPVKLIRQLKNLDLSMNPRLEFAKDMFLLSFMLRGMSFIDMAYLKKSDLRDGRVTYRRRKTQQLLTIEWTAEMQEIVDRYGGGYGDYLLPILGKDDGRRAVKNASERVWMALKTISEIMNCAPFTMYAARHSWATAARLSGAPIEIISEGLGHERESTTRIYLSQFDHTAIDDTNRQILKLL